MIDNDENNIVCAERNVLMKITKEGVVTISDLEREIVCLYLMDSKIVIISKTETEMYMTFHNEQDFDLIYSHSIPILGKVRFGIYKQFAYMCSADNYLVMDKNMEIYNLGKIYSITVENGTCKAITSGGALSFTIGLENQELYSEVLPGIAEYFI